MKRYFNKHLKRILSFMLIFSVTVSIFSGCSMQANREYSITGFAFDTTYTITLYEGGSQKLVNSCMQKCSEYEKIFSRTLEASELYQINEIEQLYYQVVKSDSRLEKMHAQSKLIYHDEDIVNLTAKINQKKSEKNQISYQINKDGTISFEISEMLSEILTDGINYSVASNGAFDITVEPITSLWNFKSEEKIVPSSDTIQEVLPYVDYKKIEVKDGKLIFQIPGMGIDLGAIAKGYIADELKGYLKNHGVKSAIINLGGNILCIGKKSEKEAFAIGIQQPFADRNETVAAVSIDDMSVVSSGIYERFFTDDFGKQHHHIINPKTGYSYDNELMAVTIISKKSVDGDGLSTTCYSLGKERGLEYIDSLDNVYAMFITKNEKIYYSKGFKDFVIDK